MVQLKNEILEHEKRKRRKLMKKILVLFMIFVMSFSMIACGGDEDAAGADPGDTSADVSGDGVGEDGTGEGDADGENDGKLDTSNLVLNDESEKQYDFGLSAGTSFGMSGAVKKIGYSSLSSQQSKLEEMTEAAVKSALSGNYSLFSDYEEDMDSIDKLVYVIGMEDDDAEKSFLETGAYHSTDDDKYYQYTVFTSENLYEVSRSQIDAILKEIKSAYGITVSQSKVEKAAEEVLKNAAEVEDYYTLSQSKGIKGSDYTEKVSFAVEGFVTEDDETGFYISVERERSYN